MSETPIADSVAEPEPIEGPLDAYDPAPEPPDDDDFAIDEGVEATDEDA